MRTVEKLSAAKVRTLKKAGTFADGNNLYLVVDESGSRRWMYRYYAAGRRHEIGGGNTSKRSLADARAWAAGLGRLRLEGKDPIAEVRRTRGRAARDAAKAMSFKTAALSFIEVKSPEWKGWKSSQQWTNSLRDYVFPIFGHVDVSEIDTPLVMAALQPHWTAKPVTMDRVRQRIALIMDWAVTAGHRQPGPNPAAWRGHLANLLPSKAKMHRVEHLAALDYRQLPEVMARLRSKYNGFGAKALEFAILSAARSNEVVGARWDEIHFPDAIWEIPAARTKSDRPHRGDHPLAEVAAHRRERLCLSRAASSAAFDWARDARSAAAAASDCNRARHGQILLSRVGRRGDTCSRRNCRAMPWPPHRFGGPESVSTLRSHRSAGQVNARLGRVFGTPDARRRRGADPRRGQRG